MSVEEMKGKKERPGKHSKETERKSTHQSKN
jgi:hypothetical protein